MILSNWLPVSGNEVIFLSGNLIKISLDSQPNKPDELILTLINGEEFRFYEDDFKFILSHFPIQVFERADDLYYLYKNKVLPFMTMDQVTQLERINKI